MRTCHRSFLSLLLLFVLLLPGATQAQPPLPEEPVLSEGQLAFAKRRLLPGELPNRFSAQLAEVGVDVLIELHDPPVLSIWNSAGALAPSTARVRAQARTVEAAQQLLLPQITQVGGRTLYRLQRTLNGVVARVPAVALSQLQTLPSVKAIRPMIPKTIDHTSSVSLIGAPLLWSMG